MLLDLLQQPRNRPYRERFMVSIGTKIHSLEVANAAFFYSEGKSSFLVTKNGLPYPMDYSLDQLGGMLDPTLFFRINRQYLISRQGIKAIYTYSTTKIKVELEPDSRHEVFVSVNRIPEFKDWLGR
jgi:DNA-binding LytR/AlgR family response regulator